MYTTGLVDGGFAPIIVDAATHFRPLASTNSFSSWESAPSSSYTPANGWLPVPSLNNASHATARVIAGAASASEAAATVDGGGAAAGMPGGGGAPAVAASASEAAATVAGGGAAAGMPGGGGAPAVAGGGGPASAFTPGTWGADGAALVEDGLEASTLDIARDVGGLGERQG